MKRGGCVGSIWDDMRNPAEQLERLKSMLKVMERKVPAKGQIKRRGQEAHMVYRFRTTSDNEIRIKLNNKIKEYEKKCNHDVKAIEYYIREKLNEFKLEHLNCYIHYGLTSQDINNMAITYSINDFITSFYYKKLTIIIISHKEKNLDICDKLYKLKKLN